MNKILGPRRMLTYYPTQRRVVKPRPLLMRLTALAWCCIATVCVLLIASGVTLVYIALPKLSPPTVAVSAPQQARSSASSSVPIVQTVQTVQTPMQVISIEKKISETAVDTLVIDPTLNNTPDATAPANNKPPQQLAEEIDTQIKQYYSLIKNMPLPLYSAQRNTLLPLFFAGSPLQQLQDEFSANARYNRYTSGNVIVKVDRLSPSGTVAIVRIVQKDWATDVIHAQTGDLISQTKPSSDTTLTARVQRGADNRWRIADILNPDDK